MRKRAQSAAAVLNPSPEAIKINMDSSLEMAGWNLLRKWNIASATVWLSFVGIGDGISFAAVGAFVLSPDETRLDFSGKGCNAALDLTDVRFEHVVTDELLVATKNFGVLPESLKLLLRTGDACTLAKTRPEIPS
jgi:hypothetical protein